MVVRRQVADLWRRGATDALATHSDWALLYQEIHKVSVTRAARLLGDDPLSDGVPAAAAEL
jgi:hypothetical protein